MTMPAAESTSDSETVDDPGAAARGAVYGTLARLFEEPNEDLYQVLDDGSLAADFETLVDRAGLDVDVPPLETRDDYDLLCARFNDVFAIGYPDPPVPLYESEYVGDGNWSEVNLDLARAYDFFGVAVDDDEREHHDHVQLELEFAGYLARLAAATGDDGSRRARRDFLDRHLATLVEGVADAVDDEAETGVYGEVVAFARSFVAADRDDLTARLDEEVSTP